MGRGPEMTHLGVQSGPLEEFLKSGKKINKHFMMIMFCQIIYIIFFTYRYFQF